MAAVSNLRRRGRILQVTGAVVAALGAALSLLAPPVTTYFVVGNPGAVGTHVPLSRAQAASVVVLFAGLLLLLAGSTYIRGLRDGQLLAPAVGAARVAEPEGRGTTAAGVDGFRRRASVLMSVGAVVTALGLVFTLVSSWTLAIGIGVSATMLVLSLPQLGAVALLGIGLALLVLGVGYATGLRDGGEPTP